MDSRFLGNDRYGGNDGRRENAVSCSNDVIPAEAGIHYGQRIPELEFPECPGFAPTARGRERKRFYTHPRPAARQGIRAGYSAASCRVPPSHAVTTSSATAPGGSALMPTSVQVG